MMLPEFWNAGLVENSCRPPDQMPRMQTPILLPDSMNADSKWCMQASILNLQMQRNAVVFWEKEEFVFICKNMQILKLLHVPEFEKKYMLAGCNLGLRSCLM
jgi:hypothetical protein